MLRHRKLIVLSQELFTWLQNISISLRYSEIILTERKEGIKIAADLHKFEMSKCLFAESREIGMLFCLTAQFGKYLKRLKNQKIPEKGRDSG